MIISVERAERKIVPEKVQPDVYKQCTFILLREGNLFTAKDREQLDTMSYCIHKRRFTSFAHFRLQIRKANKLGKIITDFTLHGFEAHFFSHKFPDGSILWFCNLTRLRVPEEVSSLLNSIQDKIQEIRRFDKRGHYVFIAKDGKEINNVDNTSVNIVSEDLTEDEADRLLYGR